VDVESALANFLASGVLALGERLGPVLWQLPPDLPFDAERLGAFLDLLPRTTTAAAELARRHDERLSGERVFTGPVRRARIRHALEVRHASFVSAEAVELLREKGVALVVADSPRRWPYLEEQTSDLMYARLHGHTELYSSGYSARSLDAWAGKARDWCDEGLDVHVYFDNDARGRAPYDAVALLERIRRPRRAA